MFYHEVAPRAELKPYVKCFWILEDPFNTSMSVERVVPDGRMELIFHYGSPFERISGANPLLQSRGIITGQLRAPVVLKPTGSIGILAVRFHPYGFSSLFAIPSNTLAHDLFGLEDVLGSNGKELQEKILNSATNANRIQILEDYLMALLAVRGNYDFRIHRVIRKIYLLRGAFRIEEIAHEFNISPRQLERLFQQKVGLSPNVFGRLVRFQSAVTMKLNNITLSLTDLGHAVGYYDQSHFIKDFKDFSGLSPGQYFLEVHRMSDLFSENI